MPAESTIHPEKGFAYTPLFAGLGALGVALQNYQATALFINSLANGVLSANGCLTQILSLGAGGICSGMTNFWMNGALLDEFFKRMDPNNSQQYQPPILISLWKKLQYYVGIFVFVVTGILFGLMAFTFAMTSPLAILSVAAGIFVAGIMTIQEVVTWMVGWDGYDEQAEAIEHVEAPFTHLELTGKWVGHLIAAGNVLALNLLFTLSLAQGLIALHVAAFPALIAGFAVAFTFGAFTEYYFYNFYLAKFCKDFGKNVSEMMTIPHAWLGMVCITINALVNGALTYSGVGLLSTLLLAANIALPPLAVLVTLAAVCAFFAGSASFILGMDFWIGQHKNKVAIRPEPAAVISKQNAIFFTRNPAPPGFLQQGGEIAVSHHQPLVHR